MRSEGAAIFMAVIVFLIVLFMPVIIENVMTTSNVPLDQFFVFFNAIGGWFMWLLISLGAGVGAYIGISKVS